MQRSGAPLRLPSSWVPVPRKKLRLKKLLPLRQKSRRPLMLPLMPLLLPAMPLLLLATPLPLPAMPLLLPVMPLPLLLKKPHRRSNRLLQLA